MSTKIKVRVFLTSLFSSVHCGKKWTTYVFYLSIFYSSVRNILLLLSQKYVLFLMSLTVFLFHILYHEYNACVFTFSCFLFLLLKGKTKLFQCCVGCLNSLPDLCTKWVGLPMLEMLDSKKSYFQQQCSLTLNPFFKIP